MTDKEILKGKLHTFKKYGFIDSITCYELNFDTFKQTVCDCVDELIEAVDKDCSTRQMKQIMIRYVDDLRNLQIGETEEREYSTHVYYELSQIVSVDIAFALNSVIYGWFLTALTTNPFAKKKKWIDMVNVKKKIPNICSKCEYGMITHIIDYPREKEEEIIVDLHAIVICKVCGEMNLIHIIEEGDLAQSFDYYIREEIPSEWTQERAKQRMEQIKVWGNKN